MADAGGSQRGIVFRNVFRILIAVSLLVILMQFVDQQEILDAFQNAQAGYVALAFALVAFNIGFQVMKWRAVLRAGGCAFPFGEIVRSLFFGITAGTLTPGQLGELAARGFLLSSERPEQIVALTMFDKLQMLAIMMIGGGLSFLFLFELQPFIHIVILLASFGVLYLLLSPGRTGSLLRRTGLGRSANRWIKAFLEILQPMNGTRTITVTVLWTVLFYGTIWIQLHLLVNAFTPVAPADSFLGFASMMLVKSAVPFSFADLGTREIGLVFFLSLRGVPEAASFNAGILLFAMNILIPSIVGLAFIPASFSFRRAEE
jgi:uncharacterized protein (TIRG00374 family)